MARRKRDFGLKYLTIAEAARVLKVDPDEFELWLFKRARPSSWEHSRWTNPDPDARGDPNRARPVPEDVIRLWLTEQIDGPVQQEERPVLDTPGALRPKSPPRGASRGRLRKGA